MALEKVKDIILNDDIEILNGDLRVDDSDTQHIDHNLQAEKGQFYQWPKIGAGLNTNLINSNTNRTKLNKVIRESLKEDNYRNDEVNFSGTTDDLKIEVIATRLK